MTRINISVAALALCSQVFVTPVRAEETPATRKEAPPSFADAHKNPNLPNFHEVHPFLYRGGAPTREGVSELKEKGVKTIIDLRNPGEKKFNEKEEAGQLGINYIAMPMNSAAPTSKQVDKMLKEIKAAQASPDTNGKVFVHCAHGSDRAGCMIGIWRVTQDKWDYDRAYREMRGYWFTPKFTNLSGAVRAYAEKTATASK